MKPEVFARYASRSLPRYTSYPTAPHFTAEVDGAIYESWLGQVAPGSDLSLYLHIPFCRSMCWYCGCNTSVTGRAKPISNYLESLVSEFGLVGRMLKPGCMVRHVHFGGGTPTLIGADDFARLMISLRSHFHLADDCEIAIEIDPRSLAPELVRAMAQSGVSRASMGVQTFDGVVQRAINRIQDFATVAAAVTRLRQAGIDDINFDLIYGLPFQTTQSCIDTVNQALELEPGRLAVFGYAHVPDFKPHQRRIDPYPRANARQRWEQASAIDQALVEAGYVRIGLDHYARPDDALAVAFREGRLHRNFQGYTTDDCPVLIGIGASAIGRLEQGFVQNLATVGAYRKMLGEGRLPVARGYSLSEEDRLRAAVIERLMCDHRVDVGEVCKSFGMDPRDFVDVPELDSLEADGLIARRGALIRVRSEGRPLIRAVAAAFDAHLKRGEALHSRAV